MTRRMNALDVWLYRDVAGRLEQRRGGLRFQYSAGWIAAARPPLSQSLPVREKPYGHDPAHRAANSARALPGAMEEVAADFRRDGTFAPVLDRVLDVAAARVRILNGALAAVPAA